MFGLWWTYTTYFNDSNPAASQLTTFLTQPRTQLPVDFANKSIVQIGDPVIIYENELARPIGRIIDIPGSPTEKVLPVIAKQAVVEFYSSSPPLRNGDYLAYHSTPDSVEWMVQMMLPPKTRDKIGRLIIEAYQENQSELGELLKPLIVQTARDAADVIRDEFSASLERHNERIRKLGQRYQLELVQEQLVPMVQEDIWPIVRDQSEPLALDIGRELWAKVSVWRFGWRLLYDRSPLPERNLVEKEFQRFLDQHGAPTLKNRVPDLLNLQQAILTKISQNEKVQQVAGEAAGRIFSDVEFQALATDILRDVFVDNERLIEAFRKNWKTEEAEAVMSVTNKRLEPTITRIGQALFGDPENSITPEFSRVLRHRILHKDDRWLVLHQQRATEEHPAPEKLRVIPGTTGIENPFHVPGRRLP